VGVTDSLPPLRLRLAARPENLAVVRQALSGVAEALDLTDVMLRDMKIAVSEACANVVVHAYVGSEGPLEVDVWPNGPELVVVVRDRGRGMKPRAPGESPGLGLGLPLIAALTEEMRIAGDAGATEMRMTFALEGAPAAPPA
jgi:anti-sigma regulatory factor (Ser/Thr protein kinase)